MTLQTISPQDAAKMINQGAVLVDIREADEHRRAKIPGALSVPLSELDRTHLPKDAQAIVFHCKSGMRTQTNAAKLKDKAGCDAYVLEGGFDNWAKQGLPAQIDKKQPLEIMRQVQIGAGSLVLLGVALGALVSPVFYALSGFAGAGLLFAGATGFCGMARLLAYAPWNKAAT